jgi:hypothetical protein
MTWWNLLPGSEKGYIIAAIALFAACVVCGGGAWMWLRVRRGRVHVDHLAVSSGPMFLVVIGGFSFLFFLIFFFVARPLKLARYIHSVDAWVERTEQGSDASSSSDFALGSSSDSNDSSGDSGGSGSSWDGGVSDSVSWDSGGSDSGSWDGGGSDSCGWDSGGSDSGSWDGGGGDGGGDGED